jgi:hypothetical protein
MPSEAPAKAAAARGMAVSAIPAMALPESLRPTGYRLKTGRFLNRRATLDVGLEGVAVS